VERDRSKLASDPAGMPPPSSVIPRLQNRQSAKNSGAPREQDSICKRARTPFLPARIVAEPTWVESHRLN